MSTFWRRLTGSDSARHRPANPGRPRARGRYLPECARLEGRRLFSINFAGQSFRTAEFDLQTGDVIKDAAGNAVLTEVPGIVATPRVIPNTGRYYPVTVNGQFTQTFAATLEGSYKLTKYPFHLAQNIAHQASLVPSSAFHDATDPVTQAYLPTAHMRVRFDGYDQVATLEKSASTGAINVQLPLPAYEQQVAFARLEGRPPVTRVFVQVTDQYRQDQPRGYGTVRLNNGLGSVYNITGSLGTSNKTFYDPTPGKPQVVYSTFNVKNTPYQVEFPNMVVLNNTYTYTAPVTLQGKSNPGTQGRQYIVDVAATDADNGGEANVAVVVPGK